MRVTPNLLLMAGLLCEVAGIVFVSVVALADDLERESRVGSTGPPTGLLDLSERRGVACLAAGVLLQVVSYVVSWSRRIFDAGGVKEGRQGLRSFAPTPLESGSTRTTPDPAGVAPIGLMRFYDHANSGRMHCSPMTLLPKAADMFDRITSDPAILGGKPIIRGTRISVELVLEWMAFGATRDQILQRHAQLTAADVEQALGYAAASVKNEVLLTTQVVERSCGTSAC